MEEQQGRIVDNRHGMTKWRRFWTKLWFYLVGCQDKDKVVVLPCRLLSACFKEVASSRKKNQI
jgi:hypothetical protein